MAESDCRCATTAGRTGSGFNQPLKRMANPVKMSIENIIVALTQMRGSLRINLQSIPANHNVTTDDKCIAAHHSRAGGIGD